MNARRRWLVVAAVAAAALAGLVYLLRPAPVRVELGRVERGPLEVTVDATAGILTMSSAAQRRTMQLMPLKADTFFSLDNGSEWTFERDGSARGAPIKALVTGTGERRNVALRR